MSTPEATYSEDFYRFAWAAEGAEITMERFSEGRDALKTELLVKTLRPPSPGVLIGPVSLNLLAGRSLTSMARDLEARQADVDWDGLVKQAAYLAIQRYRQGEPLVDLVALSREGDRQIEYVVRPFWEQNPSVLFGDGEAGKSSIALALAASVATGYPIFGEEVCLQGPVLYLDWESDAHTHAVRLGAILRGAGLEGLADGMIEYKRMFSSLKESAKETRRQVVERGFVAVVVDSLGGAKGEDAETNAGSIDAFNGVRTLGVPTFIVDHVTHESVRRANGDVPMVPFGGRYTRNYARLMWGMVASKSSAESWHLYQRLVQRKGNNTGQIPEATYRMTYASEGSRLLSVEWEPWDSRNVPEFRSQLGAWERMRDLMLKERRPLSVDDFTDYLDVQKTTVQRALERHAEDVLNQAEVGSKGMYVLRARHYEEVIHS